MFKDQDSAKGELIRSRTTATVRRVIVESYKRPRQYHCLGFRVRHGREQ
jgi:hypothetical protein